MAKKSPFLFAFGKIFVIIKCVWRVRPILPDYLIWHRHKNIPHKVEFFCYLIDGRKISIFICNLIFFSYNDIVITMGLYGSSNYCLVGATFFLYSNFVLKLVKESIFSLAVFLRKIEYFLSFGTININNLFFL